MVSKRRTCIIIAGLVGAHIALNFTANYLLKSIVCVPQIVLFAILTLGPSQAALLSLWAALGNSRFLWRVPPIILGLVVYLNLFDNHFDYEWTEETNIELIAMTTLLFSARFAGGLLVKGVEKVRSSFQFTIRDVLANMMSLAIILGSLNYFPRQEWELPNPWLGAFVYLGSVAVVNGAVFYCVLGNRWLLLRIAGVPLAVFAGAVCTFLFDDRFPILLSTLHILAFTAVWLVGSLFMVRLAGYRLTWQRPFRHNDFVPDDFLKDEKEAEDANQ